MIIDIILMKKISIIITTHNRPLWLKNAVRSAINQDFSDKEIIVVDDGSTIDNQKILAEFQPFIKYVYQNNKGPGVARNAGIEKSQAEYIQFLDDDDWLTPNSISDKYKLFNIDNNLSAVYSDLFITNSQGKISKKYFQKTNRPLPTGDIYQEIIQRNFIPVHSLLWRKTDLVKVNGFPIRYGHEDWETIIKVAEFGYFEYLDKPLGYYRQHSKNTSNSYPIMISGKLDLHDLITSSNRFSELSNHIQKKVLLKFSLQNYAFGEKRNAFHYFSLANEIKPNNSINYLTALLLKLPPQVSRSLLYINHTLHKVNA